MTKIDDPTWHSAPSKPAYQPPAGAVDAHCHVFGPGGVFPYAPQRKYTPTDAPKAKLLELRHHLGFSRNVLVQASCHGMDNRAMLDVLMSEPETTRGVAVVAPDTSAAELRELYEAGVRGIRFNFLKRLVDPTPKETLNALAGRAADAGMHIVVYFENELLEELTPFLTALPSTVVIDHMGRPDVTAGVDSIQFQTFLRLMENEKFVVKTGCPERLTETGPPYDDVAPFSARLIADFSDRVLWGTDWPHPNMKSHIPDDGLLVDRIPIIAPTPELQRKLLIDNPMRLYWAD